MHEPGITVAQLVEALKRKGVPLPFEMGTFVALEVCERIVSAPIVVRPEEIWMDDFGEIGVGADSVPGAPAPQSANEEAACRSLVELVAQLLVQSAPGVPALLLSLVENGPSAGDWTLRALRDDLEAALIPLNRAATRRVLARLLREARREGGRGHGPDLDQGALDSELNDILGVDPSEVALLPAEGVPDGDADERAEAGAPAQDTGEPAQPSSPRGAEQGGAPDPAELRRPIVESHDRAPPPAAPRLSQERERAQAWEEPRAGVEARPAPAERGPARERRRPAPALDDLAAFDEVQDRGGRGGLLLGLALAGAAVLLVVAYLVLGREGARDALGVERGQDEAFADEPVARPKPKPPAVGQLHVTSSPDRAQVLIYLGEAPVIAEDLPVGVAHEFIALSEGAAPARAVVPKDAKWPEQDGVPRYELALQTTPDPKGKRKDDLGPTQLPQEVGTPGAKVGEVRVVTSPPGAKVYLLIGFTPDATVENLAVDRPVDLLLYLRGHALERVTVGKDAFESLDGKLVADVDVRLKKG